MGQKYSQLSLEERSSITRWHATGDSIQKIAAALDRPASTVSRELKPNSSRKVGYKPSYAHEQARARRWRGSKLARQQTCEKTFSTALQRDGRPIAWPPPAFFWRRRYALHLRPPMNHTLPDLRILYMTTRP